MTIREVGFAMLRRWYVLAAGLILAVVGGYLLNDNGGLYTSRTVVSFLLPDKSSLSLNSGLDDLSVIAFAGVVARGVSDGTAPTRYSTDDAPIYGAGLREGVLVSLPNAGNQWSTSYQRAELVLQIVGPSEQWVAREQSDVLTKIDQVSAELQSAVTAPDSRIKVSPVLLTKQIFSVSPSRSAVIAAYSALLFAALIVSGWAAVVLDRAIFRRNVRTGRRGLHRAANEGSEQ
ncbi:hypothetical protein [Salinibacterium sp. M195]|uniref:hypothetical protein n=1 Tax=Salinibacterium sp. M195 TaxID=2583374 RepID=UPI001C632480|nr:hypothetical protein [Salinibacterium sp. M195]QYH36953.1 hypothetical protein FFT87_14000 [Salinibacterium sp. M195]